MCSEVVVVRKQLLILITLVLFIVNKYKRKACLVWQPLHRSCLPRRGVTSMDCFSLLFLSCSFFLHQRALIGPLEYLCFDWDAQKWKASRRGVFGVGVRPHILVAGRKHPTYPLPFTDTEVIKWDKNHYESRSVHLLQIMHFCYESQRRFHFQKNMQFISIRVSFSLLENFFFRSGEVSPQRVCPYSLPMAHSYHSILVTIS